MRIKREKTMASYCFPGIVSQEQFERIQWLLLDIDGVMTDGTLYYGENGEIMKSFHVHDGHGIKLWLRANRHVAVITGRSSQIVSTRMNELGVTHVYQDAKDKYPVFTAFMEETGAKPEEVCYIGDELVDIPIISAAGIGVAVADAVEEVQLVSDYVTGRPGGRGAVREVIETLLHAQNAWMQVTDKYFKL